jgi:hypothetical protein
MDKTDQFVGALDRLFAARGLASLSDDERILLGDAFDDAVEARMEEVERRRSRLWDD